MTGGTGAGVKLGDDLDEWLEAATSFAWPVGAGGDWLARVRPAIDAMREVG